MAGGLEVSCVKKTHLSERARPSEATKCPWGKFYVFSEKEVTFRELAVASYPTVTARFSWFVLLIRQKNEHGSSQSTNKFLDMLTLYSHRSVTAR